MPTTIGIAGFGNMNSTVALFAVNAGYRVILSNSRGPATLQNAVSKLGPLDRAATVEDAIRESDVVSVSIPLTSLKDLPIEELAGKIVIDTTNYYPERDGNIEELDTFQLSTSELVQRILKGSRVVKVFHNISQFHFRYGAHPANDPERWALPLAGDDADAKAFVMKFVSEIGFDPVDCGTLAESWRIQQHSPCYFHPFVGDIPNGATRDELFEWVKHDRSRVIKEADVLQTRRRKRSSRAARVNSTRTGRRNSRCSSQSSLTSCSRNEF
ncbi:Metalloreductase STEAP3 [Phytophthora citrophthora]|uniref:Metalloreductase STEAP3 n=1 Tax=Phytophthora citrophthora TaxID=4793 RepID=A0AAD9GYP5_9STRA|nr:Metalloreductase STEAP3 [Phytophthora citrophthora]KAK1946519.1 Metalloreductase STEAP3 [Phytophthora citrophthora]